MITSITNNNWMDQATKDKAVQRTINRTDYFANMMANNQEHRRWWNQLLQQGEDRNQWIFSPYSTSPGVVYPWDEITVPAGILRFPVYEYDMPHYYSFGALGSVLAHLVHYLVDEEGRHWDKGGKYLETDAGWWSTQTLQNYNKARKCVADLYSNATQGPYITLNGDQKTLYCYNLDPTYHYIWALHGEVHFETRVNLALKELPEFRQAFQCKASDPMVSPKPCTYY
ncbi:hypothetical protein ACOMHN_053495 [Nucella lapillus]